MSISRILSQLLCIISPLLGVIALVVTLSLGSKPARRTDHGNH